MSPPSEDRFHPDSWSYNPDRGLWKKSGPGHTEPTSTLDRVHDGTESASLVLAAAQMGQLNELPLNRILSALRDLQHRKADHPQDGCMRWYAEDPRPIDTNASFFIGLNLIVLRLAFELELSDPDREILEDILRHLLTWFREEVRHGIQYYPNKFIGDLVCAWLLHEIFDEDLEAMASALRDNAEYYDNSHFGWGEHLSDPYTTIMLDELSCLLLLAKRLPDDVRLACKSLFDRLLEIEDRFAGGPRVPTIRSYAFQSRYQHRYYRDGVFSWRDQPDSPLHPLKLEGVYKFYFGQLFFDLGWHEFAPPPNLQQEEDTIPCYNGAIAQSWVTPDARLGTLSRYPIMPVTDQLKYGLSWQTMPVALSAGKNAWGFLRWGTLENGHERFHPAKDKHSAYLNNALSEVCLPPIVGETYSSQAGPAALLYRLMPRISQNWDWLADTFTLTGFSGEVEEQGPDASGWFHLRISLPSELGLHVWFHPLDSPSQPLLKSHGDLLEWGPHLSRESLQGVHKVGFLWALQFGGVDLSGPILKHVEPRWLSLPRFAREGHSQWTVSWEALASASGWRIDPLDPDPFAKHPER